MIKARLFIILNAIIVKKIKKRRCSNLVAVLQERPELTRVTVVGQKQQEVHVVLEFLRELVDQLMKAVQKLNEYRRRLLVVPFEEAAPSSKHVPRV